MANIQDLAIPKGSTVLITGVNGFMASHVADQFVQLGYKVRGTVRNVEKCAWLVAYFDQKYGKGHLELSPVPDMTVDDAYDEAVKGVSAFIHVASVVSIDPDPEKVIPTAVKSAVIAVEAAYREPSIKRFVLTSSSAASLPVDVQTLMDLEGGVLTQDSWSPDAQKLAYTPGPWDESHGFPVYSASKVEQELAVWKYQKENQEKRPDLVVNTVLPKLTFGKSLDLVNQGHPSSSALIPMVFKGEPLPKIWIKPQYGVDVQDAGLLHVAAAILSDVKSERVFGFAQPFCWDDVLEILRKQCPDRTFQDNFAGAPFPNVDIKPRARAEELLKRLGRPGFASLEEMVLSNTEDLRGASTA